MFMSQYYKHTNDAERGLEKNLIFPKATESEINVEKQKKALKMRTIAA